MYHDVPLQVRHVDAHMPKKHAAEEHRNNEQVAKAVKIEVAPVELDWEHKSKLLVAGWTQKTSGHLRRAATYRWVCDQGVDLTMETNTQVTYECETCHN